ncbi:Transcriptional regulator, LysR family [hydrothermal vent metagenome]|uniref:Transcriptional regulator, LysR family n=1 Tax=hydrothermal vent metagenome TaxID=652676 RepID=A0A3B0XS57_9ZZZZ
MWSYDDLAIFVNVVERGSFIAAANKMKMPSSTVSRRLSRLEADLNVKLLERTSRKIHLTEKGKIFYEQCASLIKQIRENTRELTESIDKIHGKLKITVPTYLGNELMADLFIEFVKENPSIELEMLLSNDIEDILDEEIDIAIRVGPLVDSNLIAQKLWEMEYVICANNEYVRKYGIPKNPEDIKSHHSLIFRSQQIPLVFRHRETAGESKINVQSRLISNDIKFTLHAVCSGVGIACLPRMFVNKKLEAGDLTELLVDYELVNKKTVYAIYPSKRYLPKKTQLLINYIKEKSLLLCAQAD